jgi:hypothetical protein
VYHCTGCGVTVKTKVALCPLCRKPLHGDEAGTEQSYPASDAKKSRRLLIECLITLTVILTQVLVNFLASPGILWCIPSCATVLYSWLIVILARKGRLRGGIAWYYHLPPVAFLLILYSLYIIEAGQALSWYPTYGIAFCIALSLLINNGWMLVSRRSAFRILPSQLFLCVVGLIPILLALFSVIAFTWASIGTASLSLATFAAILIIYRARIRRTLRRYFYTM